MTVKLFLLAEASLITLKNPNINNLLLISKIKLFPSRYFFPKLEANTKPFYCSLQTWDLTRLVYYGFTEFCKHFVSIFPGYYIWPLRLNGSALETIFSQLKFNMNGQLSSVNYSAALTTLKLKRRIHGWRGKFVYRKTPLYVREISLKRK